MLPLVAKAATDSSEDTAPTGQNSIRDNQGTQITSQWSFSRLCSHIDDSEQTALTASQSWMY